MLYPISAVLTSFLRDLRSAYAEDLPSNHPLLYDHWSFHFLQLAPWLNAEIPYLVQEGTLSPPSASSSCKWVENCRLDILPLSTLVTKKKAVLYLHLPFESHNWSLPYDITCELSTCPQKRVFMNVHWTQGIRMVLFSLELGILDFFTNYE
jgi:hypothetical protein